MLYVYRFLLPLRLGWLLVCCLYKEVYLQIFKLVALFVLSPCPFDISVGVGAFAIGLSQIFSCSLYTFHPCFKKYLLDECSFSTFFFGPSEQTTTMEYTLLCCGTMETDMHWFSE